MPINIENKKYALLKEENLIKDSILLTSNGTYYPQDNHAYNLVRVKVIPDYELEIEPTTENQVFNYSDFSEKGFSKITVKAVDGDLDPDLIPENIRENVTIFGVTGILTELKGESISIDPSIETQNILPDEGYNGITSITVNPVTYEIDENIVPENILNGITILGVTGEAIELKGEEITVYPDIVEQIITPSTGYNAITNITVNPVTSGIDNNIIANNIREGITILGVEGNITELISQSMSVTLSSKNGNTFTPDPGYNAISSIEVLPKNKDKTINPSTETQTFNITNGYSGNGVITLNPVTYDIDGNIRPENIKQGITILGVEGISEEINLTSLSITSNGVYLPQSPYNGFSSIDVNINTVNNTNITITDQGIYSISAPYTGFETVTVDLSWIEQALESLNAGDSESQINLQDKTVSTAGIYTHDPGYDGLGNVTVNLDWVEQAIEEARTYGSDGTADKMISNNCRKMSTDADFIRDYAFYRLTTLERLILNNAQSIGNYAFAYSNLTTLYINTQTLCTLSNINAFSNTNITNIYVPNNLVNSYKTDSTWSTYSSIISEIT